MGDDVSPGLGHEKAAAGGVFLQVDALADLVEGHYLDLSTDVQVIDTHMIIYGVSRRRQGGRRREGPWQFWVEGSNYQGKGWLNQD